MYVQIKPMIYLIHSKYWIMYHVLDRTNYIDIVVEDVMYKLKDSSCVIKQRCLFYNIYLIINR